MNPTSDEGEGDANQLTEFYCINRLPRMRLAVVIKEAPRVIVAELFREL